MGGKIFFGFGFAGIGFPGWCSKQGAKMFSFEKLVFWGIRDFFFRLKKFRGRDFIGWVSQVGPLRLLEGWRDPMGFTINFTPQTIG